eukprot:TRINITY_DN4721_c0_g1_i1.p1 TRINITY_DN4721_c0_g1~~TRINITY_DN4721_c0_g1_i1.p1  ORF type:complete len:313 (+),score=21.62 TRINITY_DN4721_c0_g1_i1:228-1166(+)
MTHLITRRTSLRQIEEVRNRLSGLDEVAAWCHATWKEADSFDLATEYDFLGVRFNHETNSVVAAERLRNKISGVNLSTLTASEIESLIGRLMHASAIAGVYIAKYWFAIKFARRVINNINRGVVGLDDIVKLPKSVMAELRSWSLDAVKERVVEEVSTPSSRLTLFVDASLEGWGGVIVEESGVLTVIGDKWRREKGSHINVLEAVALRNSLFALSDRRMNNTILDIRVDNTSVMGAVRKRRCMRNKIMNDVILQISEWFSEKRVSFSIDYIRSEANPADGPSRSALSELDSAKLYKKVKQAVWSFFNQDRS